MSRARAEAAVALVLVGCGSPSPRPAPPTAVAAPAGTWVGFGSSALLPGDITARYAGNAGPELRPAGARAPFRRCRIELSAPAVPGSSRPLRRTVELDPGWAEPVLTAAGEYLVLYRSWSPGRSAAESDDSVLLGSAPRNR